MASVKVVLQNPLDKKDCVDYTIIANDSLLAHDWLQALKSILQQQLHLEKNFCFLGFPDNPRNVEYICNQLNSFISVINRSNIGYRIEEHFTPDAVMFDETYDDIFDSTELFKHEIMNRLHNHFEILQGTVEALSKYYINADVHTRYAIRQLNNLCHELESLCLSIKNKRTNPQWVRPSQITTFLNAPRLDLKDEHRQGFLTNSYDRVFGGVYMHWCQIGKTYFEVFHDEDAPELTDAVCDAITQLQYYSGEFDIEWARDVTYNNVEHPWHKEEIDTYMKWLVNNNVDINDPYNSLGYLPLGQVDLVGSFGTNKEEDVWEILSKHLDICKIEVDGISCDYNYSWTDIDHQVLQMKQLGYIQ